MRGFEFAMCDIAIAIGMVGIVVGFVGWVFAETREQGDRRGAIRCHLCGIELTERSATIDQIRSGYRAACALCNRRRAWALTSDRGDAEGVSVVIAAGIVLTLILATAIVCGAK